MALKRGFFLLIGLTSLLLGLLGIVLPLLPTVPFILLSAYCFARSNSRLHAWLMSHPWFSKALLDWQTHRTMEPRLKRRAALMTSISFLISIIVVGHFWLKIMLACMLTGLLIFLWQIPESTQQAEE
ncbi:YbaN family protein [Shewanella sp. SR44-3]|uniref:YbaN family protein n=1 Tax=unclassified Shewanella TaxID=196818 RepID=UPI0015F7D0D6|nr:YbaN family protein [Shewanella sp. SR44-3]MBB1271033.1 YbaN family protein [Shewanella sp. SR44-3]